MSDLRDPDTGLFVLQIQPAENTLLDLPMTGVLRSGDTLISFVGNQVTQENMGKVSGSEDVTLGTPAVDATGLIAQFRFQPSGTDGENYKLTVRANTLGGDIRERDVMLYVRD